METVILTPLSGFTNSLGSFFTSTVEEMWMFPALSIGWLFFFCPRITQNDCAVSTKLGGRMGLLAFGANPDKGADPGIYLTIFTLSPHETEEVSYLVLYIYTFPEQMVQ